jgi:CheY-like chemotaxis protein
MTRVLLLEDDPSVTRAVRERLSSQDCQIDSATSVADALERMSKAHFDFVVIDQSDDCLVVAQKIERRLRSDPVHSEILVPTPVAFRVEDYLASTVRHARYLASVVSNAIEWRMAAVAAAEPARG